MLISTNESGIRVESPRSAGFGIGYFSTGWSKMSATIKREDIPQYVKRCK